MNQIEIASKIIKLDEESGKFKSKPYYCSKKYPTIGWGFRIPNTNQFDPLPPITMSEADGNKMLAAKLDKYNTELSSNINTRHLYPKLNPVRQAVLLSMRHQLGMTGLVGFRKMWIAIEKQDWDEAAAEIMDSHAVKKDKLVDRFQRNADQMRTGELLSYYK